MGGHHTRLFMMQANQFQLRMLINGIEKMGIRGTNNSKNMANALFCQKISNRLCNFDVSHWPKAPK